MNNLIQNENTHDERVITLKEIVDMINVDRVSKGENKLEHSKQMLKVDELVKVPSFGLVDKMSSINLNGLKVETYSLTKKQAIAVGAKLDNTRLMMIIDKLEETNKPLTVEQVLALNAKMIDDLKNKVIKLEYTNVILEETKAEINNKKTATAMNTASQLSKKNSKLEIQLDESKSYATIKRMSEIYGISFNWRELKRVAKKLDLKSKDVFDSNYGTVKAYHREVWKKAYSLEIK